MNITPTVGIARLLTSLLLKDEDDAGKPLDFGRVILHEVERIGSLKSSSAENVGDMGSVDVFPHILNNIITSLIGMRACVDDLAQFRSKTSDTRARNVSRQIISTIQEPIKATKDLLENIFKHGPIGLTLKPLQSVVSNSLTTSIPQINDLIDANRDESLTPFLLDAAEELQISLEAVLAAGYRCCN